MITQHRRTPRDRVAALEKLLADLIASGKADAPITRTVARNLATARTARDAAEADSALDGDTTPEAA